MDLFEKVARQLAHLHPLQAQLPVGIPAGETGSSDRGQESLLLGAGPSHEIAVKVIEGESVGLEVPSVERQPEVVESGSKSPRGGQKIFQGAQAFC